MFPEYQADLSEYYLKWPTEDELDAYSEAQQPALADPLEKGVLLEWSGPSLHLDSLPPVDYPLNDTPEPTPNPPRPLLQPLLAANSPLHGGEGWSLRLIEALQEGEEEWSQVWRCEVLCVGEAVGTVVLKLRQQSLFPPPQEIDSSPEYDFFNWWPASHLIKREALAYNRLRPYQGRDIPLCYGFYTFTTPCGEITVGVVLEDLADSTIALDEYIDREGRGKRLTTSSVKRFAVAAFSLQNRLQSRGILASPSRLHHFLALRFTLNNSTPILIAHGFGTSRPVEIALGNRKKADDNDRAEGREPLAWDFRDRDQRLLNGAFREELAGFDVKEHCSELEFLV
ncbi:hypothetical protein JCM8097_004861 [Rhodosporidiobolus ruineniae]